MRPLTDELGAGAGDFTVFMPSVETFVLAVAGALSAPVVPALAGVAFAAGEVPFVATGDARDLLSSGVGVDCFLTGALI